MTNSDPDREANDAPAPGRRPPHAGSPPRWVASLGIAAVVLFVAVLVLLHLTGAVGPGAH